ncbi:MAG: hypothetical protein AAF630_03950 [Cyanobacteria bacterium P01_C01_bin.38]
MILSVLIDACQGFFNRKLLVGNKPITFDTSCAKREFQTYCEKKCKNNKNIESTISKPEFDLNWYG